MRAITLLLLAACSGGDAVSPTAPTVAPQAPPGALALEIPPPTAGSPTTIQISGAQAFEQIEVVLGRRGLGAGICPARYGGACIGVVRGQVANTLFADADGNASWTVTAPTSEIGTEVCMQAVVVRGPGGANTEISPPDCETVRATCGPAGFTSTFSGLAPGVYDVVRVPHATLTSNVRALRINPDGTLSVDGGTSAALIDADEAVHVLFDQPTVDAAFDIGLTGLQGSAFFRARVYGDDAQLVATSGILNFRNWVSLPAIQNNAEDTTAAVIRGITGTFSIAGVRGTYDTCPCTDEQRRVSFYVPGVLDLDEWSFAGMMVASPDGVVAESGRGLGNRNATPGIGPGQVTTLSFAPPARDIGYRVTTGGGDLSLEAFDSLGRSLGTQTTTGLGDVDLRTLFGALPMSAVRITGVSGTAGIADLHRTQCQ